MDEYFSKYIIMKEIIISIKNRKAENNNKKSDSSKTN